LSIFIKRTGKLPLTIFSSPDYVIQKSLNLPQFAKRPATTLGDVWRRSFWLQQSASGCGLTYGCVTMLSSSQGCELPLRLHSTIASQLVGNKRSLDAACYCICFQSSVET